MEDIKEIELRIKALFMLTQVSDVIDNRVNYKWELGDLVYDKLHSSLLQVNPLYEDPFEIRTLYGYPIEINKRDPNCIKLWKEIEL